MFCKIVCKVTNDATLTYLQCMQREGGFLFARVDGKIHEFIVNATDDEWRKRRHILTPAFSAHKMKLVGEVITLDLMHVYM